MNTKTTTSKPTPLHRFIEKHSNEVLAALYLAEGFYADAAKNGAFAAGCEHLDAEAERNRYRALRRKLQKARQ
jgi:hypothetical protein